MSYSTAVASACGVIRNDPSPTTATQGRSGAASLAPRIPEVANPIAATEPGIYETNEEHEALANVYETLVTTDATGNLAPALCERWGLGDDARSVRLHLRPDVVFSDGTPLTAAAVKASLERSILLSKDQMPAAFVAIHGVPEYLEGKTGDVSGIAPASDREIEIRLRDPLPIFPSLLTDPRTAIVFAECYSVPGMRADDQHYVSGVGRKRSRLHSEYDAHLEDAI